MRQSSIKQKQLCNTDGDPPVFTRQDRDRYLAVSCLSGLVLCIARWLQPPPSRVGAHTQLGLPPCLFLHFTGIPCPGCGMTTSFAHAARLHVYEAFITQPFGLLVFLATVLSIPLSIYLIHRRVPWAKLRLRCGGKLAIQALIALFALSWLYKIAAMK